MAVYEETINLGGDISAEAKSAAAQMTVLSKAITSTQTAMTKVSATHGVMSKEYLTLAKKAGQLEEAQGKIPKGLLAEAEAHKLLSAASAKTAKGLTTHKEAVAALPPATSAASSSTGDLNAELAEMTGGISVAIEAVLAVGAAFGAVVVAGMAMAIAAVEAKQKMLSLFDALGEGKVSGAETVAMLDKLGDSIGQTRAALAPLAQAFMTMGVTGTESLRALTLAAASAGALAEGGAEKFTAMFGVINAAAETGSKMTIPFKKLEKQLAGVGLNIGDMAKQMGTTEAALTSGLKAGTVDAKAFGDALTAAATSKGAGPLATAGASLANVWAKAQENISKFFEDIDVGPFLAEVKSMFDILGQANPSGQALKTGIGAFFKNAFTQATKLVPLVKHFLLDVIIYGLKAYLALKPIIKSIKEFIASATGSAIVTQVLSALWEILKVVGISIAVLVGALVFIAAMSILVATAIWSLIGAFISLMVNGIEMAIKSFSDIGAAIGDFVSGAVATLAEWVSGAADMAVNFVKGLVDGIKAGAAQVIGAVTGLASSAKNAFKGALGISSPSKVMMEMGGHAASGVSEGITAGVPDVHAASKDLADAAAGGFAAGDKPAAAPAAGGGGGGGVTVNVEPGAIVIQGGSASASELTEQAVSLIFERVALAQGL